MVEKLIYVSFKRNNVNDDLYKNQNDCNFDVYTCSFAERKVILVVIIESVNLM